MGWRACCGFGTLACSFQVIFILLFRYNTTDKSMIMYPFGALVILLVADHIIQKKTHLIEFVFFYYSLLQGFIIAHEGYHYNEYRYHESWLIYYMTFLVVSISTCFKWKRMVLLYWLLHLYNFIQLHLTYSDISTFFYLGYVFINVIIPLVIMVISRVILGLILVIYNNQDLVKTIKKILEGFPEGIIIQSVDQKSDRLVLKFINDDAKNEIIQYEDPTDMSIDDESLSYALKSSNNCSHKENADVSDERYECNSLSKLLLFHTKSIQVSGGEFSSSVELCSKDQKDQNDESANKRFYNIKTLCVKWDGNNNSFIHVFINTTAVKQFEMEKTRNEVLHLMFSNISHEFRTPINAFSNSMSLIELGYQEFLLKIEDSVYDSIKKDLIPLRQKEINEKLFKICKISTTNLLSLVEDILDLAKIQAGTFKLNNQMFLIDTLAAEIGYIFEFQCTQKGIAFKIKVSDELKDSSFCSDIGRIKQVLINLISNAYKFTVIGKITLKVSCEHAFDHTSFERRKYLKFKVYDTGVGISENEIPKLFQLFGTCGVNQNNLNSRGTGLGLAISKKIVESLGGHINIKSNENIGTKVTFTVRENYKNENKAEENKKENERLDFNENFDISISNSIEEDQEI